MGDLNLGIDIAKLKKSAGGGGGGGGGGIVCDELFTGTITKGTPFTIEHPYTDYVFLQVHTKTDYEGTYSSLLSVPGLATGANNSNVLLIANTQNSLRVDPENPTSILIIGSGTITNAHVYGYK